MRQKQILFLVPPNITFGHFVKPDPNMRQVIKGDGKAYGNLMTDMPIGLMSMSAYVKEKSQVAVDIQLVDFNIELNNLDTFDYDSYLEYFLDYLSNQHSGYKPDIIGVSSLFTPSYFALLDLGRACRTRFPESIIVAGGSVPSSMYKQIYSATNDFDALCYGEGELPFLGLIESEDALSYIEENASWITKTKIDSGVVFEHHFIENLDEIPFYDYDLCDPVKYGINPGMTAYAPVKDKRTNAFHVMTSRGCPFKCTFCASHKVHGRKMRYYSLERVRADFDQLKNQYLAGTLIFQDDHLMGDVKRAYDIIRMVKELELTAIFQNGLALYALDRKMLEALRDAGVTQLVLAAESGSERVLKKVMRKPLKLSIVKQVANDCRDLGIYTNVNILIGMPGETKEDIEDSREFLKGINANWFIILAASPLVGSEMYDICEEKGYLADNYLGSDYRRAVVQTPDFSAQYIQEKMYEMNIELNFVENADFRKGDYSTALKGFENAIRAKNDHAIAYYFAAQCYEKLGDRLKGIEYMDKARRYSRDSFWSKYIDKFKIPIVATTDER
ncbi:MAG: B12-binding domain-containing radical SAM protein [Thiotrichaceae bacterium IS1]|nr:MAG: B12-binding domain-containing radical SAM protein [Thiotrichaceae bacterium IS1]